MLSVKSREMHLEISNHFSRYINRQKHQQTNFIKVIEFD